MQKVIRTKSIQEFVPLDQSLLRINTTLPFDCYVKKGADFFIRIEAGTMFDEALQKSVADEKLYIRKNEEGLLGEYKRSGKLPGDVTAFSELYQQFKTMLERYFEGKGELYVDEINEKIEKMTQIILTEKAKRVYLLRSMEDSFADPIHGVNVMIYATILAQALTEDAEYVRRVALAAFLHDIGKGSIDEAVLNKNGMLNEEEFSVVKEHPKLSEKAAHLLGIKDIQILSAIRNHHEHLDGSGYPNALKGKSISKMAQIIGISDNFDALTSDRSFRKKFTTFEALKLMRDEMLAHYEREILTAFIKLMH